LTPQGGPPASRILLRLPEGLRKLLRQEIEAAGGREVHFFGAVSWEEDAGGKVATLDEVEVVARGSRTAVPAFIPEADGWDVAIHNHPSGDLEPSDADLHAAAELGARGVGFAIISNDAARIYVVKAPFPPVQTEPIDLDEVRAIFQDGGPLSGGLDGFESRDGQVSMALEVASALNEDRLLACEAGTGIGKSFAYLVPAILWSIRNGKRVVVSTGTINLQEQLIKKDLPFLEKVLPVKFTYALSKGRGNYACRRKVEELERDLQTGEIPGVAEDERQQLRSLVEWAKAAVEGSRSDLSWIPPAAVWEQVMSETDKSLKAQCPHYDKCFFYEAKRAASRANIIVANHHLLFADLATKWSRNEYESEAVLPPYDRIIFDEAHHLEDVASEHFGVRFSRHGIITRLTRLRSLKDPKRGTAAALARRLRAGGAHEAGDWIEAAFSRVVPPAVEEIEEIFGEIEDRLHDASSTAEPAGGTLLRQREDHATGPFWRLVRGRIEDIQAVLEQVLHVNEQAIETVRLARVKDEEKDRLLLEPTSFQSRLDALLQQMAVFRNYSDSTQVRWIESSAVRSGGFSSLEFASAPIRVAGVLREALFQRLKTVVMTSATLSVGGTADFLADRLGLSGMGPDRFRFTSHPSPFEYARQVLTAVPSDFPVPDLPGHEAALQDAVLRILEATRGRAFVLFTSYSLLRRTYAALEPALRSLGLLPVAQGDRSRTEILEKFKAGVHNVLFGTDSFWEGVDVKGRALECVILTRLPFRVPSEPVQEARLEEIRSRGENDFKTFTVPQAVLKFKQGFGRLIRSKTDRGVVAVLDRRILSKPYGKVFLASLPETSLRAAPLGVLVREIEEFFRGDASSAPPWDEAASEPRPTEEALDERVSGAPGPPW
jgi:ATP-dependent DNA helicase DinG